MLGSNASIRDITGALRRCRGIRHPHERASHLRMLLSLIDGCLRQVDVTTLDPSTQNPGLAKDPVAHEREPVHPLPLSRELELPRAVRYNARERCGASRRTVGLSEDHGQARSRPGARS